MKLTNRLPPNLSFDLVESDEVSTAHALETAAFPADEVTPIEQFRMRQEVASQLFLGAFLPPNASSRNVRRVMIAFMCATRADQATLTQASMREHSPKGCSVCIHNVVVASSYQRRGIALALLEEYIARMRGDGLTERVLLICHGDKRVLYEKAGFVYVGRSSVVIGSQPWDEMRIMLNEPAGFGTLNANGIVTSSNTSLPPGLLDALQEPNSSRNRLSSRLVSSFSDGLHNVCTVSGEVKTNKYDILCPRAGCGSVILKAGIGQLNNKELPEIEVAKESSSALLVPFPPTGSNISCWLVQPNPMAFENIGFSHAVEQKSNSHVQKAKLKLLSCVDCDLGPLGWCVEGGQDFWLVCTRVGYRA